MESASIPPLVAQATTLIARYQDNFTASKNQQEIDERPRIRRLRDIILQTFRIRGLWLAYDPFSSQPGSTLGENTITCNAMWRPCPFPKDPLLTRQTRHVVIDLGKMGVFHWTERNLDLLCNQMVRACSDTLQILEIHYPDPENYWVGLLQSITRLSWFLLEMRGITEFKLVAGELAFYGCDSAVDRMISQLAVNNKNVKSLTAPRLSNESLTTIANSWPDLYSLTAKSSNFSFIDLALALRKMKNLHHLDVDGWKRYQAMRLVAQTHAPSSLPHKLTGGFQYYSTDQPLLTAEDYVGLFSAFPALDALWVDDHDVPAVCAGLGERRDVRITKLKVNLRSQAHDIEPLLALVGRDLVDLELSDFKNRDSHANLSMVAHYCPTVNYLIIYAKHITCSEDYEMVNFSKLRKCKVCQHGEVGTTSHLPESVAHHLLFSPYLEEAKICLEVAITQETVIALFSEDREEKPLSSLKEFIVGCSSMTTDTLAALVSRMPRLRRLSLSSMPASMVTKMELLMKVFFKNSGLKAKCVNYIVNH